MLRSALSLEIPKVAFETQQNSLYGSRLKLSKTLSTDRVLDRKSF
ncbi:hypothetical protein [Leptospira noguchii]|nr:hypothetical protein [Leptospira noguchii]